MATTSAARAQAPNDSATPKTPPAQARWSPVRASTLYSNLEGGIDFHLGQIETAITADAKERVSEYLRSNFGDLALDIKDKYVKKLANSALSHGSRGLSRTLDALEDLPFWSKELQLIQNPGQSSIPFIDAARLKLNGDVCESCGKKLKETDGTIVIDSLNHYHLKCWSAIDLREYLAPLRSSLIAVGKQAKSSRVILKANEKDFTKKGSLYESTFINSRKEYEKWLDQLFFKWLQLTDVKEEFRSTYWSNFKEYSNSVLRYVVDNQFPVNETEERLLKHLEQSEAKKITKRLSSIPVNALRYLGLIDEESKKQAHLISYLETDGLPSKNYGEVAWQENALCATTDPSTFFDGSEGGIKSAIRVCNRCPVKVDCLDYALKNGEMTGIWGGKTPEERKQMASQMSNGLKLIPTSRERENTIKSDMNNAIGEMYKFEFKKYADLREIGEKYRDGYSVILSMSTAPESERKRAIDFLAGLVFAHSGSIQKIGDSKFILFAPGATAFEDTTGNDSDSIEALRSRLLA